LPLRPVLLFVLFSLFAVRLIFPRVGHGGAAMAATRNSAVSSLSTTSRVCRIGSYPSRGEGIRVVMAYGSEHLSS
jgi:hypothetical protein